MAPVATQPSAGQCLAAQPKRACLGAASRPQRGAVACAASHRQHHALQPQPQQAVEASTSRPAGLEPGSGLQRRTALAAAWIGACIAAADGVPAHAGILEGGVEWWKSRKRQNGGAKLIAPIKVAQQRLESAREMLATAMYDNGSNDLVQVLQTVRASSLNCYLFEPLPEDTLETKASLFTQRNNLSDPCTFRIVVKNATDFGPPEERAAGEQLLGDLILSYQKLDSYLDSAREGSVDAMAKAKTQLVGTLQLTYDIEAFVRKALLV